MRAGYFNPSIVPWIRTLWKVLPEGSVLWKKVDILAGLIMGSQFLHERFVEQRIASNPSFEMEDRARGDGSHMSRQAIARRLNPEAAPEGS